MNMWKEIRGWEWKMFHHHGRCGRRYTSPSGAAPIEVCESSRVDDSAAIGYGVEIGPCADIGPGVMVGPHARIGVSACVGIDSVIADSVTLGDAACIGPDSRIGPRARIGPHARIGAGVRIGEGAFVGEDARIDKHDLLVSIGPLGSAGRMLTVVKVAGAIRCWTGCFAGTKAEFLAAVKAKHGTSPIAKGYLAAVKFATEQFRLRRSGGARKGKA